MTDAEILDLFASFGRLHKSCWASDQWENANKMVSSYKDLREECEALRKVLDKMQVVWEWPRSIQVNDSLEKNNGQNRST